jgi:hypothetical protein
MAFLEIKVEKIEEEEQKKSRSLGLCGNKSQEDQKRRTRTNPSLF